MASEHDEPIQDPYRFESEAEPPKKPRGCFFYGCIVAIVLAILMAIAAGVAFYFFRQFYFRSIEQYTSPTPMALPKVEMPEGRARPSASGSTPSRRRSTRARMPSRSSWTATS